MTRRRQIIITYNKTVMDHLTLKVNWLEYCINWPLFPTWPSDLITRLFNDILKELSEMISSLIHWWNNYSSLKNQLLLWFSLPRTCLYSTKCTQYLMIKLTCVTSVMTNGYLSVYSRSNWLYEVREWSLVAAVVTVQCGSNFNTNEASLLKIH